MEGASSAFAELLADDLASLASLGDRQATIATLLRTTTSTAEGRQRFLGLDAKFMLGDLAFTLRDLAPAAHDRLSSTLGPHQSKLQSELGAESVALIWSITSMARSVIAVDRVADAFAANDAQRDAIMAFGLEWWMKQLSPQAALKSWYVIKKLFPPETLPALLLSLCSVALQVATPDDKTPAQADDNIREAREIAAKVGGVEKLVVKPLNVRLGPGKKYPKIDSPLAPGSIVSVVKETSDGWTFVRRHGTAGDTGGWVASKFLKDVPEVD
ncbi:MULTISPECIES: SH3 domain-containing protein [Pseudomonas]|uniref:SH3 domain-containing protein n=2 Tax=Pseudomonas TaxID=286 RepID=A0A7Z3BKY6_9PSED|nr:MULTISPECIES: SH3 domain-containing protein [Pseudomonas]QJP08624.1 SH3 domain-containing protein [Pseudomonas multiresinivorans]TLX69545.1 SH3 domain-containing protein [Pseudomonas nicosulfuronedens]